MTLFASASFQAGIAVLEPTAEPLTLVPGAHSLAVHGPYLASAHDQGTGARQATGVANLWQRDTLTWLGAVPTGGRSPCSSAFSPDGRFLAVAHFRGMTDQGVLTLFPVTPTGLAPATTHLLRPGSGPGPRQACSHIHSVRFLPTGELVLADLGTDAIAVYDLDAHGHLHEVFTFTARPGSGPRSLAIRPGGTRLACTTEMGSTLLDLAWDPQARRLTLLGEQDLRPGATGGSASDAGAHPTHDVVYAAHRGQDHVAVFTVQQDRLVLDRILPCGGTPRALAVADHAMAIAVEGTSHVLVHHLGSDGLPQPGPGTLTPWPSPVAVAWG